MIESTFSDEIKNVKKGNYFVIVFKHLTGSNEGYLEDCIHMSTISYKSE